MVLRTLRLLKVEIPDAAFTLPVRFPEIFEEMESIIKLPSMLTSALKYALLVNVDIPETCNLCDGVVIPRPKFPP